MKFNIIIPFYKNYDTIEGLLNSIADQDYDDYDVTIVVDGEDEKAGKQLTGYIEERKFNFCLEMLKENKGASFARNFGAQMVMEALPPVVLERDLTQEEMSSLKEEKETSALFFVDADCKLMPGILTDFDIAFDMYPDVDFLYGNYRNEMDKPPFLSQGFDPYLLETMNYIPTMSPIRRKAFDEVGGFDDRPYFQDWGLFYKLAKAGKKGQYLGKNLFVFSTKSPTKGSISGNQELTLAEKCTEFREYYGIETKELVVTTFGAPLQAIQRAKMLNADYVGLAKDSDRFMMPANYGFENWKYTYMVGCYNQTINALENHLVAGVGRPIYHFIGSDVFSMFNTHSTAALIDIKAMFKKQNAILLSNSSRCQEELAKCGLETDLVFTPIYEIEKYKNIKPLPEKFTVAVYVSDTNRAHMINGANGHSNIPLILDVASSTPDIEYKFFGIEGHYEQKDNIEFCGRIPESHMVKFINECSMCLRSTIHDGFPQLPIQFILCGRGALVSAPDEELKYAKKLSFEDNLDYEKNKDEMITKLYEMKRNLDHKPSELWKQLRGNAVPDYYKKLMSVETFRDKIKGLMKTRGNE